MATTEAFTNQGDEVAAAATSPASIARLMPPTAIAT
jgi:hypothetical protein